MRTRVAATTVLLGVVLLGWQALAGPPASYWPFEDTPPSSIATNAAGGPAADLRNMDPTAAWVAGRFGNALTFGGSNQYLNIVQDISETDNTVSLWFQTTAAGGLFSVNQPGVGPANDRNVWLSGGNVYGRIWSEETINSSASGINFADGNWHHVVHQYGPNVAHRLYMDGRLVATGAKSQSDFNWQTHLHVGWTNTGGYFNGEIDDVAVWDEQVAAVEIYGMAAGIDAGSLAAATANWTGGTGAWENASNWSTNPVVPGPSHIACVANGGTAQITGATGTADPAALAIGGGSGGSVSVGGGGLATMGVVVGPDGTGQLDVTAGNVNITGDLVLGDRTGGDGTVAQSNGTVAAGQLFVGLGSGSTGRYDLSGTGQLAVSGVAYVGHTGTGTVDQSGGQVTVAGQLRMGETASGQATWNMTGGSLTVNNNQDAYIGINGASNLNIGGSSSLLSLNGGRLEVGYNTQGTITQTDGTVTVNNSHIVLGRFANADATYTVSGGTLQTAGASGNRNFYMAWDNSASQAELNVSDTAQVNIVGEMNIGGYGTATVNQTGGTVTAGARSYLGRYSTSDATYNISHGTLNSVGVSLAWDNAGSQATLNVSGDAQVNLTSTLEVAGNGTGTVEQTGGDVTVNNAHVVVGRYNAGVATYNMSGGTLQTTGGGDRNLYVAWDQDGVQGNLNLSNDAVVTLNGGNVYTGRGTSTITVADNAVLTAANGGGDGGLVLGRHGGNTATLTQTGGTVQTLNNHVILGRWDTAKAVYDISDGVLQTTGTGGNRRLHMAWDSAGSDAKLNVSGTGQVIVNKDNVSGATGFLAGEQGTAEINVSDNGSITVYGIGDGEGAMSLGRRGTSKATVNQTGGTVTLYDNHLIMGRWDTSEGIYSISAGTLKTAGTTPGLNRRVHMAWDHPGSKATMDISGTGQVIVNADDASGYNTFFVGNVGTAELKVRDSGSLTVHGRVDGEGAMSIGRDRGVGTVTQTGGTVTLRDNYLILGRYNGAQGTYEISGGTLTQTGGGDQTTYLGWDHATAKGTLKVGGTATVNLGGNLIVGGNGTGEVTQTGGSMNVPGTTFLGYFAPGSGTLHLNGGTFTTSGLQRGAGTAAVGFDGGTLRAGASFASSLAMTIDAGGATFDTNGNAMALSGTLTGAGGLTKNGAGTLTLAGVNSYGGATTINQGTLRLPGPVAVYTFDDGTASDAGSGGYHGSFQGDAHVAGGALVLDGAGDYVQLPDMGSEFGTGGTVALWVKLNQATPTDTAKTGLAGFGGTGNNHYPWTDGYAYVTTLRANGNRVDGIALDPSIDRAEWHLVTITSDPSLGWKMYQNGVERRSAGSAWGIANWTIGRDVAGFYLDGEVDLVVLLNYALSPTDVQNIYYAGRSGAIPTTDAIPDTSPVAIAAGATLDVTAVNETIGPLSGAGNVDLYLGTLTVNSTADSVFSGEVSGSGGLVKTGSGRLTLGGTSTYTGPTGVSQGTLQVDGSIAASSLTTVAAGAILSGSGWVGDLHLDGTLSPAGNSGTIHAGNTEWDGGADYLWQINDADTGTAGGDPGWDLLEIAGTLDITATDTPGDQFTINITTLAGSSAGPADGSFDVGDVFMIASTTEGVLGFDPGKFLLDLGGLANSFDHTFVITSDGANVYLNVVPEPSAFLLAAFGLIGIGFYAVRRLKRRK